MAERRKLNLFKSRGKYLYKIASKPILKGKDVEPQEPSPWPTKNTKPSTAWSIIYR